MQNFSLWEFLQPWWVSVYISKNWKHAFCLHFFNFVFNFSEFILNFQNLKSLSQKAHKWGVEEACMFVFIFSNLSPIFQILSQVRRWRVLHFFNFFYFVSFFYISTRKFFFFKENTWELKKYALFCWFFFNLASIFWNFPPILAI